jgi:hypothetical protein
MRGFIATKMLETLGWRMEQLSDIRVPSECTVRRCRKESVDPMSEDSGDE